jgi:hypothetical protein
VTEHAIVGRVGILDDVAQLTHLGLVLKLRDAAMAPVLAAAGKLAGASCSSERPHAVAVLRSLASLDALLKHAGDDPSVGRSLGLIDR